MVLPWLERLRADDHFDLHSQPFQFFHRTETAWYGRPIVWQRKDLMNVLVQGKTLPITAALRAFAQRQATKLMGLGVRITQIRVFLENVARKTGEANRAEVRYKIEVPGKDIVIEKKGHDLYSVLVSATERAKQQVLKLKQRHLEKARTHRQK
jgi:ribosomal subunit interface protein